MDIVGVAILIVALGVLAIMVEKLVHRVLNMNEKLMVMLASRDGDTAGARLLSMNKPPQGRIPGVATITGGEPLPKKTGTVVTFGGEV